MYYTRYRLDTQEFDQGKISEDLSVHLSDIGNAIYLFDGEIISVHNDETWSATCLTDYFHTSRKCLPPIPFVVFCTKPLMPPKVIDWRLK